VIKMRHLYNNKKGISNVLGYLLSFAIASVVMVSAVIITSGIINNRTAAVAELQAQSIANKVADAIVEAVAVDQSTPEGDYTKTMDIPLEIAGRQYYIDITDAAVYVNTTDGLVSKSAPTYGAGSSKTGVSSDTIYSGGGEIEISLERSDVIYKFDFGTGNNTEHSPVESGHYMVSNTSSAMPEELNPPWWNQSYPCRIPIKVENNAMCDVDEATVKIVLNPSNFDYSLANVTVVSPSIVSSNLVFVDTHFSVVANIEVNHDIWYTWWANRETDDDVEIRITELSEGYDIGDIQANTVKLNGYLSWETWEVSATPHFDADAALKSISSSGGHGSKYLPPSPGDYTVTISGLLDDGASFSGRKVITVADGDILVDKDFDVHTPGWGYTHFDSIQNAISAASTGDTIYVYNDTYDENIVINKQIRLFGEDRMDTVIDGSGGGDNAVKVTAVADNAHIDTFTIRDGSGGGTTTGNGIFVFGEMGDSVTGFTLTNCDVRNNKYNGIYLYRTDTSNIINCNFYYNGNSTGENGIHLWNGDYIGIINCTSHHNGGTLSDGLVLEFSNWNLIENCWFHNNSDDGINFMIFCNNNTIRNCHISDNGDGGITIFQDSDDNNIIDCDIHGSMGIRRSTGIIISSEKDGTHLYFSERNTITGCKVHHNVLDGIMLYGTSLTSVFTQYTIISNCEIYNNENDGISIWHCRNNIIKYCNLYNNAYGADGNGSIEIYSGSNNTIKYCNCHHNDGDGIGLVGSVWNDINNCSFHHNDWGVCIFLSGANNSFSWCQFHDNNNDGAYLEVFSNTNVFRNCDFYSNAKDGATVAWYASYNWFGYCNFFDNGDDGFDMIGIDGIILKPIVANMVGHSNIFGNKYGAYICGGPVTRLNSFYYNNIEFNSKNEPEPGAYQGFANMYTLFSSFQFDNKVHLFARMPPIVGDPIGNFWGDYDDGKHNQVWIDFVRYDNVYEVEDRSTAPVMIDRYPVNYDGPGANSWQTGDRITGEGQRMFIQVDDNNPGPNWYDYYHVATITEALSHVTDYGTIYIHDGTYKEAGQCLINKKGVTMFGESRENVIIDGEGVRNGIHITRDDVTIKSLTVENGNPCGISIAGRDNVNITNCNVTSTGNAHYGIYIYSASQDNIISNCYISTTDKGNEYGVYIRRSGGGPIRYNTITNCNIYNHGKHGIYIDGDTSGTDHNSITNCEVYSNDESGICISSDVADYNDIIGCTIYDNGDHGVYLNKADDTNIANCYIRDNGDHGVYIYDHADGNTITNTFTYDNELSGIYLSNSHDNDFTNCDFYNDGGSDQEYGIYIYDSSIGNNFTNCKSYSNNQYGIYIRDNSDQNEIYNNEIYDNTRGIFIEDNSEQNSITNCEIYDNTHGIYIRNSNNNFVESNTYIHKNVYGIYIIGNADGNTITNCDIYDSNYNININDSSCTSNKIYYNNFKNCTPLDRGTNQWDSDDYQTGGNHWDDYDEGWEGAYDFYQGENQDITGSDGKVDTPRNISGKPTPNQDRWPLGGGRYDVRPYYIDYWNPYGESVILVKMNLESQTSNYLYLYYGYDKPLTKIHNHTIDEVSVFSDDFENSLSANWTLSKDVGYGITSGDIEGNITDGCLNLTSKEFIITKDDCIPEIGDPAEGQPPSVTTNESTYVVEARMKLKEGQGNMMVLGGYEMDVTESRSHYTLALNKTPNDNLSMYKYYYYNPYVWPPGPEEHIYHLQETTTLDICDWLRMKSYVYTGKTCYKPDLGTPHDEDVARISSYLYNFDTFADEGSVSAIDTYWYEGVIDGEPDEEAENGEPYMNGKIGLGCGLMSSEDSDISVDWIRVMKTPAVTPTITIGAPESVHYGWENIDDIKAKNILTFNPFTPGPELRDFNYGTFSDPGTFNINLPADDYVITITMGNHSGICNATTIQYPGGTLTIPETKRGTFETKWFPIQHNGGDLPITFWAEGADKTWTVNSLMVEKGGKGIRVGAG